MIPRDDFYDALVALDVDAIHEMKAHTLPLAHIRSRTYGEVKLPGGFRAGVFDGYEVRHWFKGGDGRGPFVTEAHRFYVVHMVPVLPLDVACEVIEEPYDAKRGPRSGEAARLGSVARPMGVRGGLGAAALRLAWGAGSEARVWHVDTLGALATFLRATRRALAKGTTLADAAAREVTARRRSRDMATLTAPGVLGGGGAVDRVLRAVLHDDRRFDALDPDVARLRAKYPPLTLELP